MVLVTGAGVDTIAVFDDVRSSAGSGTFGGLSRFQIWHRRTLLKHFRRVVAHCRNSAVLASLLVSVPWVNSTGPLITCSERIAATMHPSLHPLHVTPQLCRVHRQLLQRHPDMRGHSRSLLAQFGLPPKSKRGLGAGDPGEAVDPL